MPLSLAQTVVPTDEPMSLELIKLHLRVSHDREDALIYLYMQAAREEVERITRRQLMTATYTLSVDDFPACGVLLMPRAPLQSVVSVGYLDSANVVQTLATTIYGVDTASEPGRLFLKQGQSWPSVYSQRNAITITYQAGWALAPQIPPLLKMAILLLIGHFYEHREVTVEKALTMIPQGLTNILWLFRVEVL
jgi:uncharacterized phiE125 gp8 family phage protein